MRRFMGMAIVLASICVQPVLADWKDPADKKITEDELKLYLETANDWNDITLKILEDVNNSKTDAGKMTAVGDIDKKQQACLDKHHISEAEYKWVAERAVEAWGMATYADDVFTKGQTELQAKSRENDDKLADAQKRLATYQQAEKDGNRVMSDDDRQAAIKAATDDRQSALDEVKQRDDEVKSTEDEVKQHTADAKAAEEAAKNPPADVTGADRDAYVQNKNNEVQAAYDVAREAQDRVTAAKKARDDAQTRADAAAQKAAHPESPVSDDEKASVKSDNDAGIAQAQADIDACNQAKLQLATAVEQLKHSEEETSKSVPAENIALLRKYSDQYKQMLEHAAGGGQTKPSN